jgi:hypothetical protein
MRTYKPLSHLASTTALVEELDDTTLMGGHALLNPVRAEEFCQWIDLRLDLLESKFCQFITSRSLPKKTVEQ